MTDLFESLTERGFVHDATPGLAQRLRQGPITAYVGFDPTSDSLHVGNLVPVMGLAWLQRSGGTPIPLQGGGTGMVGDPSGKRGERPIMTVEQIDANAEQIRRQLERFLRFDGANGARMRNNADWLRPLSLMGFLRDTGKHFTVSYMLQKESVKSRLETGISYTEFSYMLVQAYDFWHLFRAERCELQMGGSDQWGNITAGTELISRREQRQAHGLVFPLLTTASGGKFGKTEVGNVWLDPARTSIHDFRQFWFNSDDRDVERYLKLFTFLPLSEIADLMAAQRAEPGKRLAQRRLARELITLVHGEAEAKKAEEAAQALFGVTGTGKVAVSVTSAGSGTVSLPESVPRHRIAREDLGVGTIVDHLVSAGLAKSKSEARRGIQGKGYYLNDKPITNAEYTLTDEDLVHDKGNKFSFTVLRKGKKNHVALVVED